MHACAQTEIPKPNFFSAGLKLPSADSTFISKEYGHALVQPVRKAVVKLPFGLTFHRIPDKIFCGSTTPDVPERSKPMMFFKAAERSGKLQHLSRIFLTSVLIIAAVAAVFALCACVSDIGTAPISPAPTGNIGIETPDVEPTDIPYEISATYELYYFENRRLEQCVREQLFWEGKIFLGDILSVTKLDLSHCGINDISELAAFKNLVELDLSFNTVQSLEPLTQLKKLKRLTLNNVSASDFTFLSQLSQLCELSVRQCAITDLTPFSSAVSLQTLDISGNAVSDLSPISALSKLINLYADSNAISDLSPISNLSSLETLSLHGNDITAVEPLSSLTDLHYLDLSGNDIGDINPICSLKSLHTLDLSFNAIESCETPLNSTGLLILNLSSNKLTDISVLLSKTRSLQRVILTYNPIDDFSLFFNMKELQFISAVEGTGMDAETLMKLQRAFPDTIFE